MKLHLLGINGPFPESRGATSGYLLETGNSLFCFDLGSGVLGLLTSLTAPESLSALFVSHWHYDHTADPLFSAWYPLPPVSLSQKYQPDRP